jgi:hypothetical protein
MDSIRRSSFKSSRRSEKNISRQDSQAILRKLTTKKISLAEMVLNEINEEKKIPEESERDGTMLDNTERINLLESTNSPSNARSPKHKGMHLQISPFELDPKRNR